MVLAHRLGPRSRASLASGLIFFIFASATIATTRFGGGVAFIWVASAILLAQLYLLPMRRWRGHMVASAIGSVVATALFGFGPVAAVPLAIANIAESAIGAALMRRWSPQRGSLESLGELLAFVGAAGIIAPAISGLIGATVAYLQGWSFADSWVRWFTGHALGALTFVPIALLLFAGDFRRWVRSAEPGKVPTAAAILVVVTVVTWFVFAQARLPLLFLPILPVVLATFWAGRFGAATALVIVTLIGGYHTTMGGGPVALTGMEPGDRLQLFQFYLAATVITTLPVAADLARRRKLYLELRDSEARYRLLMEKSTDIVTSLAVDGTIRFISPSIRMLGGWMPEDVIGQSALKLVHPDDQTRVTEVHRRAVAEPDRTFIVDFRGVTATGEERWFETHTRGVPDTECGISGVVSVIRDVTHRRQREAALAREAETDALTGLVNRRGFLRLLDERLAAGTEACVAIFDIDHFKRVNDQHGHAAGDLVLEAFAAAARVAVREGDVVGRLGGEEFAILLDRADLHMALAVCERVRASTGSQVVRVGEGRVVRVTVSAGVAAAAPGQSRDDILAAADAALYRAKLAGRNRLELAA